MELQEWVRDLPLSAKVILARSSMVNVVDEIFISAQGLVIGQVIAEDERSGEHFTREDKEFWAAFRNPSYLSGEVTVIQALGILIVKGNPQILGEVMDFYYRICHLMCVKPQTHEFLNDNFPCVDRDYDDEKSWNPGDGGC